MSWLDKLLGIHSLRRENGEVLPFRDTLTIGTGLTVTHEPETKSNRIDAVEVDGGGGGAIAYAKGVNLDQGLTGNQISNAYTWTYVPCILVIPEPVPGYYAVFYSLEWTRTTVAEGRRVHTDVWDLTNSARLAHMRQQWTSVEDSPDDGEFPVGPASAGDISVVSGVVILNIVASKSIGLRYAMTPEIETESVVLRVRQQRLVALRVTNELVPT